MLVVDPCFSFMHIPDGEFILSHLELAARTCYKSEDKASPDSARKLLTRIIHLGHDSVLEHCGVSVRIVCDRGVTHELVRHRLCSFSQESTRYANYAQDKFGRELTVIRPFFWQTDAACYQLWLSAMQACENAYLRLVEAGATAQEARSVLPNSLKTEIVTTANLREWRHIFKLRCDRAAHPQMRQIMLPLLAAFQERIPLVFDDLATNFAPDLAQMQVAGGATLRV